MRYPSCRVSASRALSRKRLRESTCLQFWRDFDDKNLPQIKSLRASGKCQIVSGRSDDEQVIRDSCVLHDDLFNMHTICARVAGDGTRDGIYRRAVTSITRDPGREGWPALRPRQIGRPDDYERSTL